MTRTKTKMKSAKARAKTKFNVFFTIHAPHALTTIEVDLDKVSSRKFPTIFRDLAKLIETGELRKELERELDAIKGVKALKLL